MTAKGKLIIERFWPFVTSLLICIVLFIFKDNYYIKMLYQSIYNDVFLTAILTSLSIIFGFILTSFTLIYSSNSNAILALKESDRFQELIDYNKIAVYWLLIATILTSLLLLSFHLKNTIPHYDYFVGFWSFSILFSVCLSIRFLSIFYLLL